MAKVFVPQEPLIIRDGRASRLFSLKPAEKFGELRVVLDWSDTREAKEQGCANAMRWKIRAALEDIEPGDFILMVGDFIAMSLVVYEALEAAGRINCLQWDREERRYKVVEMDVDRMPPSTFLPK